MSDEQRKGAAAGGLAVGGVLLTGLAGFVGAVVAFLRNEYAGTALFLLAAGVSYGLLANAIYRQ